MALSDMPPVPGAGASSKPAPSQPMIPQQPKQPTQPQASATFASPPKAKQGQFGVTKGGPTGADAANTWLQSAMAESQQSDTHKAVMVRH